MGISPASTGLRRQVINEACAWFIEFRTADAAATTRDRFDEWLRHSPEHIQAYLEVAAAWAELPTHDAEGRIDVAALVERARASREEDVVVPLAGRGGPASASIRGRRFPARRALAASVAAVVIIAGAVGWLSWHRGEIYTTGTGEQRTIRLSDDSIVDLNARSSIRVKFSRSERTIELKEGQAMFHVARDPGRPFVVRSDTTAVRAVGTQFDVYRKGSGLVVTVVEGRVAVGKELASQPSSGTSSVATADRSVQDTAEQVVLLSAGEQLTVTPTSAPMPHRADVSAATAWVQRRLIFEDTPLADVAEEFNRYSVRRLVIDDEELARKPISGIYSSSDPDSLVGFLRAQPTLQVMETDQEIRVTQRSTAVGSADPE
jgi:transmembrane sensor